MEASIPTPEFVLLLSSINNKLDTLIDVVGTKKKKSDIKKEEKTNKKKNTTNKLLFKKTNDGKVVFNESSIVDIDSNRKFFYTLLAEEYPNICMMPEPLTFEEYNKLIERFTRPLVKDMMTQVDNYRRLDNYKSAYRVLATWLIRDERKK